MHMSSGAPSKYVPEVDFLILHSPEPHFTGFRGFSRISYSNRIFLFILFREHSATSE